MGEGSTERAVATHTDAGSLGLRSPVRTTAVGSPLTVSFAITLLGKHSPARLIALCCADRTGRPRSRGRIAGTRRTPTPVPVR